MRELEYCRHPDAGERLLIAIIRRAAADVNSQRVDDRHRASAAELLRDLGFDPADVPNMNCARPWPGWE